MRAHEMLASAQAALQDRAATRDQDTERSMALTVRIFGAMSGVTLSELDGWRFMLALKLARAARGQCHVDDWIDLAGYAALAGECQVSTRLHAVEAVIATRDPMQDDDEGREPAEPPRLPVSQSDED